MKCLINLLDCGVFYEDSSTSSNSLDDYYLSGIVISNKNNNLLRTRKGLKKVLEISTDYIKSGLMRQRERVDEFPTR